MRNLPDIWREMDRPFTQWRPMLRQLDDFLNEVSLGGSLVSEERSIMPFTDLEEKDDYYLLSFDMPGIDKQDIDIEVQGNRLLVSGERRQNSEKSEGKTRSSERRYKRFERSMSLPIDAKSDAVEAEYHNGVLSVVIPKSAESKRQHIKIGEGKTGFFSKLLGDSSRNDKRKAIDVKESNQAAAH